MDRPNSKGSPPARKLSLQLRVKLFRTKISSIRSGCIGDPNPKYTCRFLRPCCSVAVVKGQRCSNIHIDAL